jgi:hypothetical protein
MSGISALSIGTSVRLDDIPNALAAVDVEDLLGDRGGHEVQQAPGAAGERIDDVDAH